MKFRYILLIFSLSILFSGCSDISILDWLDEFGGPTPPMTPVPTATPTPAPPVETEFNADDNDINFGKAVATSGMHVFAGAPDAVVDDVTTGAVYAYTWNGGIWVENIITASDGSEGDSFGFSVSGYGDKVIIGAPDTGLNYGTAYIYTWNGSEWGNEQIIRFIASDPEREIDDHLGYSVDITDTYAIIGAQGSTTKAGQAHIYIFQDPFWVLEANLEEEDKDGNPPVSNDNYFGHAVSISGEIAAVSYPGNNGNFGGVYVYHRENDVWIYEDELTPDPWTYGELEHGQSVDIEGNWLIAGTPNLGTAGSAFIYYWNGTMWGPGLLINAPDGSTDDMRFGETVSINGDYALVGAPLYDSNKGNAYLLQRSDLDWEVTDSLSPDDSVENEYFGCSVNLSEDFAVVGAYTDTVDIQESAFVFCELW